MIGYARVSTNVQDLTAQRDALTARGDGRVPGRRHLVMTKLGRLARSMPDTRDIVTELTAQEVKLSLGGSVHDPTDPAGRLLFNVLAMVAEFESDLIKMKTREA